MKILTSFVLVFLLASPIISYPNVIDEYLDENGSGEEVTDTTTSTTIVPVPKISFEVKDLIEKVSTRFNELRIQFLKNQQDVYNKVDMDLENYKILRDISIKTLKDAYDQEIRESTDHLKSIDAKKSEIENSIEKVLDSSWNKEENSNKLKNLKKRNKLPNDMKSGNCEDCDGFLDDDQIDVELRKNDNEIAELEGKTQKQDNKSEIRRRQLNDDETRQLIIKYSELIHVYQKEVEERKKNNKLEFISSMINDEWRNYAEKLENIHEKVRPRIEKLTKNSLKVSKLTSNESSYSNDDDWENFNIDLNAYKWIPFSKYSSIPSDAVLGGEDTDGSKLYVIRTMNDDSYLYGKFAVSSYRNDIYFTNSNSEFRANSFELLISKNYTWCDAKTYKILKNTPSVCKTTHSYESVFFRRQVIIPGTLLKDGKCRVGFGWSVYTYAENVKVLGFGSCENSENVNDLKFWF